MSISYLLIGFNCLVSVLRHIWAKSMKTRCWVLGLGEWENLRQLPTLTWRYSVSFLSSRKHSSRLLPSSITATSPITNL